MEKFNDLGVRKPFPKDVEIKLTPEWYWEMDRNKSRKQNWKNWRKSGKKKESMWPKDNTEEADPG